MSKEKSPRRSVGNVLATTTAIAATAVAGSIQPASAERAHTLMTPAERQHNTKAHGLATSLAKRIIHGYVNHRGGYTRQDFGIDGQQIATQTVTVAAPDLYSPRGQGEYRFSVQAPVLPSGKLNLNQTKQITFSEGVVTDTTTGQVAPYAEMTFAKSEQTGAWAFIGTYLVAKQDLAGVGQTIEASIVPTAPLEARFTYPRLVAAFQQASHMISSAEALQPTGAQELPFAQPPGTAVNLLK